MTLASKIEPTPNENIKKPAKFLRYIHNFRGFAILTIVATHTLANLKWSNETTSNIAHILIANGTVYFVFIAGFLFQFLSSKYEYKSYLLKKLQYVLLPYFFTSIPAIAIGIIRKGHSSQQWFTERFSGLPIPEQILMYLLTGGHLTPFWFIPMITIFYIISPLLLWVDRHPKVYWIIPTLLIITAIVPRPDGDSNTMQSFVHYLSIYLVGMFCSHYKERLFSILQKKYFWLLISYVVLTALEMLIIPRPIAINSLSKLILCVLIIYFLWLTEARLPKLFHDIMGVLAELSFGIYFLHDYFLRTYALVVYELGSDQFWLQASILGFSLLFLFGVGGSLVTLLLIKRIFGEKSRFIVGC